MIRTENLKIKYPLLFSEGNGDNELIRKRYQSAWNEAGKAAEMLKKEFNAKKVMVFGSLTDTAQFDKNSDIDLAAIGIPEEKFYAAVGAVTLLIKEFKVDLLDAADCRESICKAIERDGVEI